MAQADEQIQYYESARNEASAALERLRLLLPSTALGGVEMLSFDDGSGNSGVE